MNLNRAFNLSMNSNGPPGIIHPLLIENYSWVDIRLRKLYYDNVNYIDNDDITEYQDTRLLQQKMSWRYKLNNVCEYKIATEHYYYDEDTFNEHYDDTPDFANFNEQDDETTQYLLDIYLDGYDSESYSFHFGSDGYAV